MSEVSNKKLKSPKSEDQPPVLVEDVNLLKESTKATIKINALKNLQVDLLKVEAKFYEDLHDLECKYAKLYEPFYEKRRKIIIGDYEPTEEEGKWTLDELNDENDEETEGKKEKSKDEEKKPTEESKALEVNEKDLTQSGQELLKNLKSQFDKKLEEKGIKNFWLETLQSLRVTAEIIHEHDEPILEHLEDVRVRLFDKAPFGYTLEFEFSENPYFTNKILTKTYYLKTEVDPKDPFSFDGPDLDKAIGSKIDWKQGKNVTIKLIKKKIKPRNKKGAPKVITKEEKQESFFNFFDTPKPSEKSSKSPASSGAEDGHGKKDNNKQVALRNAKSEDEDDDDDEEDEADLYLIADFEIGQYIKEKLIPKAILYYTGEDLDDEYDDYEDEDEDEEDEDGEDDHDGEDDDEEEDDDDDDEEDEGKKGGKGGKKQLAIQGKPHGKNSKGSHNSKGGGGGEPTPSECKQN